MKDYTVRLEPEEDVGEVAAQLAAAKQMEADGRPEAARTWLARAAKSGTGDALMALGVNLLTRTPHSPYDGVKAIVEAANTGHAEAIHLAGVMAASGAGLPQNWPMAFECLHRAADLGLPLARNQLALLTGGSLAADIPRLLKTPPVRAAHSSPRISIGEEFLSAEICDWLVARARPKIERARTFDPATGDGRIDSARSNSSTDFNIAETDLVLALVRARIAAILGLPVVGFEHTTVLHYAVGQEFSPHYDFLDPGTPALARDIAQRGQRAATFLVYLNDGFDGAETAFLDLDWRYRGRKGDAILFWNVDSTGAPDRKTRHAGLAPTHGEKWLLSQWIRVAPAAEVS